MGQIYIPVINWFLLALSLVLVCTISSIDEIGNAYGIAELGVMMMTTILVTLVMLLIWQIHIIIVLNFVVLFLGLEGCNLGTIRAPRIGLLYNELVKGIPAIFGHFLTTLPAIHSMIIFVSIKYVPVPMVLQSERFLFRRVCPKSYHIFRCIARYSHIFFVCSIRSVVIQTFTFILGGLRKS